MAGETLVTMTLDHASGVAEDNATMDFAFKLAATVTSADADDIQDWLDSWITTTQVIPGVDHPLGDWIGGSWKAAGSGTNTTYRFYNVAGHLDGSPHGSPLFTRSSSLAHAATNSLPGEVGMKSSFHGDLDGVLEKEVNPTPPPAFFRPAARRKGGVFIPWIVQSTSAVLVTSGTVRPSVDLIDTIAAATDFLMGESGNTLSVWSRVDEVFYEVVGGWVDNAFDTIRKRGPAPSSRTTWT